MGFVELLLLAVGLSMDAFAVAVCKGLAMGRATLGRACIVGLWFGGFQAAMPFIGYLIGSGVSRPGGLDIRAIDHWIAFALLALIGFNMIREARSGECDASGASLAFKAMLPMAVATSIDALAVGLTFAFLQVELAGALALIGCTTFLLSALGVKAGGVFGERYKAGAELAGGCILILLGLKILLEHLGVLPL